MSAYAAYQGPPGPAGAVGAPGERWFTGAGAPVEPIGDSLVGDWYLNSTNGDYYDKTGTTTWTLRGNLKGPAGAAAPAVSYGTTLPASPVDGQEAILVDSLTNPSYQWRFRYNAGSTSPYKWEFVGGSDAYVRVDLSEATTTTGVYVDLATVGPRILAPRPGDYDLVAGADGSHSANNAPLYVAIVRNVPVSPALTNQAAVFLPVAANSSTFGQLTSRITGCASGEDLRLRYYNVLTGTATFAGRWLRLRPLRVS